MWKIQLWVQWREGVNGKSVVGCGRLLPSTRQVVVVSKLWFLAFPRHFRKGREWLSGSRVQVIAAQGGSPDRHYKGHSTLLEYEQGQLVQGTLRQWVGL